MELSMTISLREMVHSDPKWQLTYLIAIEILQPPPPPLQRLRNSEFYTPKKQGFYVSAPTRPPWCAHCHLTPLSLQIFIE